MFVAFNSLPETSRIWIYQTERTLTDADLAKILEKGKLFIDAWQSHGNTLKGSVEVLYRHFVIVAIDEGFYAASGCSIDKSVHFIQDLGLELKVDFLDRSLQAYLMGETVSFFPVREAKPKIIGGELTANALIFNNNISSKEDLQNKWLIEAGNSWMGRFFKKSTINATE